MNCLNCDKELVQVPGKRKKEFCNSTCRSGYWQKQKTKEKEYARKLQSDIEKVKKIVADKGPVPPTNTYENKDGDSIVTSRKEPPEGYSKVPKIMPKGLSLDQQIQWKIDNL